MISSSLYKELGNSKSDQSEKSNSPRRVDL